MLCRKCGFNLQDGWIACPSCGTKVQQKKKTIRRANGMGGVYKRGNLWTARVTVGWKLVGDQSVPVRKTKGGFKTRTEALAYCQMVQQEASPSDKNITLERLYLEWKSSYQDRVSEPTMLCYNSAFQHYKTIHYRKFESLRHQDMQDCIDACPAKKRTKELMKVLMSLLYKYAMSIEIVDRNRSTTLYTGNEEKGTHPPFTMEELGKIYRSALPYADYILIMCYLGYRPTEMLSMKKTAYDRNNMCLVGGIKTEAGKNRIVTIPPPIVPYIEWQMKTPGEFLFPNKETGRQISQTQFRCSYFNPVMKALGIEGRVPYSCRHTFANLIKNIKGSDTDKSALMGHADTSMTKYYQSADYTSLRAITDNLVWVAS